MTEHESTPGSAPLDAERVKLRAAGYTESEISQILISRATGAGSVNAGPGTMSNVIGSLVAVAGYAAGLFLGFRGDATTLFDGGAKIGARVAAALALAFKVVVIGVLSFGAWQEWQQHIISGPSTAASNAELTEAQARKAKAEADAAEQIVAGEKAKACAERLKLMTDNMYMDDVNADGTFKAGSRSAAMMEKYTNDCGELTGATGDPSTGQSCDDLFRAVLADMPKLSEEAIKARFADLGRFHCHMTSTQTAALKNKLDELNARNQASLKAHSAEFDQIAAEQVAADHAHQVGDYRVAFDHAQNAASKMEALETEIKNGPAKGTALAAAQAAWHALFVRNFPTATVLSERALSLDPKLTLAQLYRAHALMFEARTDEAKTIYLAHRGETVDDGKSWEEFVIHDFAELRKANISDPLMKEIESTFAPSAAPAAAAEAKSDTPATPTPTPTSTPLRIPTAFNCAKASLGVDYVICASPKLLDAVARLEDAYFAAKAANGPAVVDAQWAWIKRYGPDCGLPLRGRPADAQITGTANCVSEAIESRIRELQAEQ